MKSHYSAGDAECSPVEALSRCVNGSHGLALNLGQADTEQAAALQLTGCTGSCVVHTHFRGCLCVRVCTLHVLIAYGLVRVLTVERV